MRINNEDVFSIVAAIGVSLMFYGGVDIYLSVVTDDLDANVLRKSGILKILLGVSLLVIGLLIKRALL